MWVCVSMCVCVGVSVSVRVRARVSARACLQRLVFVCLRVVSSYPARSITRCVLALSRLPGACAAAGAAAVVPGACHERRRLVHQLRPALHRVVRCGVRAWLRCRRWYHASLFGVGPRRGCPSRHLLVAAAAAGGGEYCAPLCACTCGFRAPRGALYVCMYVCMYVCLFVCTYIA